MKRPLLWGFVTLGLGIVGAFYRLPVWAMLGFVGLLAAMPFFIRAIKVAQMVFVLGLFGLGVFLGYSAFPETDRLEAFYQKDVSLVGVVTDYPILTENRLTFNLVTKETIADADENNRLADAIGIRATIYYPSDENTGGEHQASKTDKERLELLPGDLLLLQGKLSKPPGKRNPGGFDYGLYLKSQSIDGLLAVTSIKAVGHETTLLYQILGVKRALQDQCETSFSEDVADLLKGVVFGEKNINEDLAKRFQDAGVTHVLAVSGLHVGYLFLALSGLLIAVKINKRYWILFDPGIVILQCDHRVCPVGDPGVDHAFVSDLGAGHPSRTGCLESAVPGRPGDLSDLAGAAVSGGISTIDGRSAGNYPVL